MSGSKLVAAIFIIIILSLGGLLGFYFYLNRSSPLEQAPVAKTKTTFSGFDQVTLDNNSGNTGTRTDLGSYNPSSTTTSTSTLVIATTTDPDAPELPRLISAQPIAGADFIIRDVNISTSSVATGTSTAEIKLALKNKKMIPVEFIRFILKSNGNIFETGTSSTSTVDRITIKTIPKLHEAFFNAKGDGLIIRSIIGDDGILTRFLSLKPDPDQATSTIQLSSSVNLPLNITQLAISPDKTKIFYIRNSETRGTISNLDGGGKVNLFDSPFREWLTQWASSGTILLNTKPSALAQGYLYSLDAKNSNIKKLLGGVGLTSLASNDGQNIIYTTTEDNDLHMILHDIKSGSERPFNGTLPEKCVWGNKYTKIVYCAVPKTVSSEHNYPDDWYLGFVSFDDTVWRLNTETGENKVLMIPDKELGGISLDIINMRISKNDDYLMFEDKTTMSLWGLKLKSPYPPVVVATSTKATKVTKPIKR